jgi:purine-binding chemotaxis protein CheW
MKKKPGKNKRDPDASPPEEMLPDAPAAGSAPASPNAARVSSPVEVATTFRLTPPVGMRAVSAPAVTRFTPPSAPSVVPATEDYATSLMRRLAAMAPPEFDEEEAFENDRQPLRDRVRNRTGIVDLLLFRIGDELFATDLASVEEAVTLPEIHHLPEMPAAMLGAFNLRGRLTPVYSPAQVLGVSLRGDAQSALLVRADTRRLGLAVDDVEDVFQVDLATVHDAPGTSDADGILLGVAHHGKELVAIVDAEALVSACIAGQPMETA